MTWLGRLLRGARMERRSSTASCATTSSGRRRTTSRRGSARPRRGGAPCSSSAGVEQVKEECRDARGTRLVYDLGQDLRYGLRMLRKSPGFTVVAIASLALGIGANTAIFTLVDSLILRALPVRDPGALVRLKDGSWTNPIWEADPRSAPQLVESAAALLGHAARPRVGRRSASSREAFLRERRASSTSWASRRCWAAP